MRILTMVLVCAAFSAPATCQPAATASDVAFLHGCWEFEAKGRIVEEQWMAPAGGTLMGMSRTVVNGKVAEFEFLQIRDLPGGLTYIAKPSNQPEAAFVATSSAAGEIVFENPAHDFPQRIRYALAGDILTARVEGKMQGKTRSFDIPYVKVNCRK
jgi:hypothetical protein